jgi:acetoacetate decarboxylase
MRSLWLCGFAVVLAAAPGAAQSFEGTHLDPFTLPYPDPPALFEGSRVVAVTFTTSPDVVEALVPAPLTHGNQITAFAAEHHIVSPIPFSYNEGGLLASTSYQGVVGTFHPILYLDEPPPIYAAREIWGFSKVSAEIDINWLPGDDSVIATVSRSGTTLIRIDADFGPPSPMPPPEAVGHGYALKLVPSGEAGGDPDVCQLTRTQQTHSSSGFRTGTGTLVFGSTQSDPLADIPINGIVDVVTYYADVSLPFGQVVWDYLAQPGGCAAVLSSPFIGNDSFESFDASD